MVAIWPRTTRAVKAVGLIGGQQRPCALDGNVVFEQGVLDALQGTPAARRSLVELNLLLAHRRLVAIGHTTPDVPMDQPLWLRRTSKEVFRLCLVLGGASNQSPQWA